VILRNARCNGEIHEILLGSDAAISGNQLPTFRNSLSVPSSGFKNQKRAQFSATSRREPEITQFNFQQLYALPTLYVFCIYLRTNSDLCHLQRKLIGFYNRDEKCLQRGTDWVLK